MKQIKRVIILTTGNYTEAYNNKLNFFFPDGYNIL